MKQITDSEPKRCDGCGHDIDLHMVSVSGRVVCVEFEHRVSDRGVMGLHSIRRCDCRNFRSPAAEAASAERKRMADERDASLRRIVDDIRREAGI